jgi:hypothetical protein
MYVASSDCTTCESLQLSCVRWDVPVLLHGKVHLMYRGELLRLLLHITRHRVAAHACNQASCTDAVMFASDVCRLAAGITTRRQKMYQGPS